MPVPPRRLKELIEGTVDHHASQRWPALEEVTISWRGSYCYLTGYLSEDDNDTIKLCRIQYLGDDSEWAFAIWQASTDTYTDSVLLNGRPAGHPSQALDTACTLYLADTDDQPAEPLKELRGAALVHGEPGAAHDGNPAGGDESVESRGEEHMRQADNGDAEAAGQPSEGAGDRRGAHEDG
jgi:hypothetical protein